MLTNLESRSNLLLMTVKALTHDQHVYAYLEGFILLIVFIAREAVGLKNGSSLQHSSTSVTSSGYNRNPSVFIGRSGFDFGTYSRTREITSEKCTKWNDKYLEVCFMRFVNEIYDMQKRKRKKYVYSHVNYDLYTLLFQSLVLKYCQKQHLIIIEYRSKYTAK